MPTFNPLLQTVLDDLLLAYPLVRAGKKLCACLYEQGVGHKLKSS